MPPTHSSRPPAFLFYSSHRASLSIPPLQNTSPHLRLHIRTYSTPTPLLKTHNIPAPHTGHIRILTLSSPHNRNALSRQLLTELSTEISTLKTETETEWARFIAAQEARAGKDGEERNGDNGAESPSVGQGTRALILASGIDEAFCAGADLKERRGMTAEEYVPFPYTFPHPPNPPHSPTKHPSPPTNRTQTFLHTLRHNLSTLSALPLPTISAIASTALGGGLELALATTFRVIASDAVIGLPETRLGIIPGAGGCWRLRELVGESRALEWVLTGKRVSGAEAGRWGVGTRVVEGGDGKDGGADGGKGRVTRERVLEGAVGLAREVCEGGPVGTGAAIRAVRGGEGVEGGLYEVVRRTEDRDEALVAFREKRRCVFRGR